jgi:predicted nucleic acid-binding protein
MSSSLLVLDTWVIAKTKDAEDSITQWKAIELLSKILNACWGVAPDYEDEIRREYRLHMGEVTEQWLIQMSAKQSALVSMKVVYRGRNSLTMIDGFDPDDMKFIELAINVPGKRIVTGDSDFLTKKTEIRTTYGIEVLTIQETLDLLSDASRTAGPL